MREGRGRTRVLQRTRRRGEKVARGEGERGSGRMGGEGEGRGEEGSKGKGGERILLGWKSQEVTFLTQR